MSKGSKIVPFRVSADLYSEITRTIRERNRRTRLEPWTTTAFILAAIREKLAHMSRSRSGSKGKGGSAAQVHEIDPTLPETEKSSGEFKGRREELGD